MAARTTGEVGKMNLVLCRAGENIALMDAHLQAWRSLSLECSIHAIAEHAAHMMCDSMQICPTAT